MSKIIIPLFTFPYVQAATDKNQEERKVGGKNARQMKIHDALNIALKSIPRRLEQRPVEPERYDNQCNSAETSDAPLVWLLFTSHQTSIIQSNSRTPKVRNITSNPIRRRNHGSASPISPARRTAPKHW